MFTISVDNPTIVKDAFAHDCLRFDLIISATGETEIDLFRIPGWRVMKKSILPPARKVGKIFVPTVILETTEARRYVQQLVEPWKKLYPQIEFPEVTNG